MEGKSLYQNVASVYHYLMESMTTHFSFFLYCLSFNGCFYFHNLEWSTLKTINLNDLNLNKFQKFGSFRNLVNFRNMASSYK